jgi:putative peptidoglycan lipid II flippase
MVSRLFGLVRDQVIAYFFGAGILTDAFFVAFGIPNLLRRLFGEGALNAATVPVISEHLERDQRDEAWRLVTHLFNLLFLVLFLSTLIGIAFAPILIRLMAWGFSRNPGQISVAARLLRLMFPYAIFVCLAALEMGALNSFNHFSTPAAAPIMLNISMISLTLLASSALNLPIHERINWLAYGVLTGGILQMGIQIPPMLRRGWRYGPSFELSEDVKRVARLMAPAAVGQAVVQINLMVDRLLASFLPEGSLTYLYYANRLVQLPLGVFGIAISTAVLPFLSRQVAREDLSEMKRTMIRALRLAYFICFPAMVGMIVLRKPIIALLFEHGEFNSAATSGTAWALLFYSLGLFSYSGAKIVSQGFYSLKDTRTPVLIGGVAMGANIVLNILLMRTFLKHGGLALATALSSTINMTLLLWLLRRRIGKLGLNELCRSALRVTLSGAVMGTACWIGLSWLSGGHAALIVAVGVPLGISTYLVCCRLLRVDELEEVLRAI